MRATAPDEEPARRPSVDLLKTELMCKRCGAPLNVRDKSEVGYEEAGTVWLWALPELLGWPSDITWLFSPVTGNTKRPGDAWVSIRRVICFWSKRKSRKAAEPQTRSKIL